MNASMKVPTWFKLENYDAAKNFTASQWAFELSQRRLMYDSMFFDNHPIANPRSLGFGTGEKAMKLLIQNNVWMFHAIRKCGLLYQSHSRISREEEDFTQRILELESKYGMSNEKTTSVSNVSITNAWCYLATSTRFPEIDGELKNLLALRPNSIRNKKKQWEAREKGIKIASKYSHPLATIDANAEKADYRFAKITMTASDQQIMREFSVWLSEQRESDKKKVPKKLFTIADFLDWHDSRILPYFDLTTFAQINETKIPLHAIADALFPNEIDVDVAERVRKVTKRKTAQVFTYGVIHALELQAISEKTAAE